MNLFFVENDASVGAILTSAHFDAERDFVVCVNYLPYLRFREQAPHANVAFIEELFDAARYRELHEITDRFAYAWRWRGGRDATVFDGMSFGDIAAIMLPREYLTNILVKYGEAIRLAVQRHAQIDTVVHDLSNEADTVQMYTDDGGRFYNKKRLVSTVADQLGLACRYMPAPRVIPSRATSTLARFTPAMRSGRARLASLAKAVLFFISDVLYRARRRGTKATYVFSYFNLSSLLEHSRGRLVVSAGSLRRVMAGMAYVDFLRVRTRRTPEAERFVSELATLFTIPSQERDGCPFVYNGVDYGVIYRPVIAEVATNRIPQLVDYSKKIAAALERYDIGRLVTTDVMTEMGKTRVATCRSAGCEVWFVDHGIMGHRFAQQVCRGYDPDLIVKPEATDPQTQPYAYELRAPALTLGNPSMDPYATSRRKRVTRIRKILLTTFAEAYYGRLDRYAYQELYFKELFTAVSAWRDAGFEIHYRPHNENIDYHMYLFDFFGIDAATIRYSPWRTPFRELIYDMDLLVCSVSNVFYEAQAAGVPAIFLDPVFIPDALWPPLNGKPWEEVIRVETGEALAQIALRNRDDASELNGFLDRFLERHAPRYMHELDARAGERIAKALQQRPPARAAHVR